MGFFGLFRHPEAEDLYDDYDYEEAYDEAYDEGYGNYSEPEPESMRPVGTPGVQPIHSVADMQIILVQPKEFKDASLIADYLREMKFVVLNLAKTDPEVGRRLLDFVSGVLYSEDGHIMKIANRVFVAAPYFVDLLGNPDEADFLFSDRGRAMGF